MSSPPHKLEEHPSQDWNADRSLGASNVHDISPREIVHENGESTKATEEAGPLLPSKTAGGPDLGIPGAKPGTIYREKQIKPNKVYVGGLPEHTRQEDLQACFGKIGRIVSIELKIGFGFVEFVDREAAEESVAKYNEGYFMGNKIRVELSHGGGRTAKFSGEPGACFKCGQMGHWARECPNHVVTVGHRKGEGEGTLLDRVSHPRNLPPPPRSYSPYRDDYRAPPPPSRDSRYGYDYPSLPPSRDPRDYRARDYRPVSPSPRDYRDYGPLRSSRDVDDYRRDYKAASSRYDSRSNYYPDDYSSRTGYLPTRDVYDSRGYDRRPSSDRYGAYPPAPPMRGRSRTPPRSRVDYDKLPPRDFHHDYRGRPVSSPPRYSDSTRGVESGRYRRRSQSPVPRSGPPYNGPSAPPVGYSGAPAYSSPSSNLPAGYPTPPQVPNRPPTAAGGSRDREYSTRPRESGDAASYPRRL